MLKASVDGLRYHRVLAENVTRQDTVSLKQDFDYSFVVSYGEFQDSDYEVVDKNSCLINLSGDIDSIFSTFKATCRNEIRRTEKIAGLSFHDKVEDFDGIYSFHRECEEQRDWYPIPREELRNSIVFYSAYRGIPISGMSCYSSGTRLRVGRIFSRRRADHFENLQPIVFSGAARRIVFELCKFGKERGFLTLDLGGIDIADSTKSGITQFKMSFSGEAVPVKIGRFTKSTYFEKLPRLRELGVDLT